MDILKVATSHGIARFSTQATDYIKSRPSYPSSVIECLRLRCALSSAAVVADIGSGPGNFAVCLLENGNEVLAVEPNKAMRRLGKNSLGHYPNYRVIDGTAEDSHLPDSCVSYITAAQSFHWFDQTRAKAEFKRILEPGGWVILLWNEPLPQWTSFVEDVVALLSKFHTPNWQTHRKPIYKSQKACTRSVREFFGGNCKRVEMLNPQLVDSRGLGDRLFAATHAPGPTDPRRIAMSHEVEVLFNKYERDGYVRLNYQLQIYLGHIR